MEALSYQYEAEAKALQAELAALKKADGGQLTAEHLAYVQNKLVALLDAYHAAVRQNDPLRANADGSPAR